MATAVATPLQDAATAVRRAGINPWVVALTVTLATFMELLDTSIANVSLPYIAGGLGRSFDEVTWILTTYLVANAVVLPMSAWLSRVFGRKNYYMACVALFTITSFFCGIAPSLGIMLMARVLQGIGGGGLAPVEQAILVDTFEPAKRASAFALYTVAIVTAPAIGPVLGGWITDNYNWRWVFLINIPIGALSLFLTHRFVHDPPAYAQERATVRVNGKLRVDGIGIALIGLGSAALEILLDRGQIDDWFGSPTIVWCFVIAVTCLTAAVFWELNVADPVIDFRLLKVRNFAIANVFYFVFGVGLFASTTMIPQILQSLYGYRAIDAGLGAWTGRVCDYAAGPGGCAVGTTRHHSAQDFAVWCGNGGRNLIHPLQSHDARERLLALCVVARAAGAGLCVLLCAALRAGVFAAQSGAEQQGVVIDELLSQLGRKFRHCVDYNDE